MSYSQYPRPGDVTDYPVPTQQLQRLVQFGAIWGGLWVSANLILSGFDLAWGKGYTKDTSKLLMMTPFALGYVVFAIAFAVIVFQWVRLAWQTVVGMRQVEARLGALAAAWLCVVPVVNFVGLTYVMDFLVVRSRSRTERTMNAISVTSSEPLATAFFYSLVLHCFTAFGNLIPPVKKYIDTDSIAFTTVDVVSHIACYWLGYLLSKKVNDQLKAAAIPPRKFL